MRHFLPLFISLIPVYASTSATAQRPSKASEAVTKIKAALVKVQFSKDKTSPPRTVAGVLVDRRGLVLVPCDKLERGGQCEIEMASGVKLTGKAILAEPKVGFAFLKVDGDKPFPHAKFADSDGVEIGDIALVVAWVDGSSSPTAAVGIVSAKNRRAPNGESMLQVDSFICPGFSPGILVDLKGNLLGVLPKGGGPVLIVPSNRLKEFMSKLPRQPKDK